MPLGRISHSWSGGHLANILKLPVNGKFIVRGFFTAENNLRKPLARKPLPASRGQPAQKTNESAQIVSQLKKLLSKEKPNNPAFNEFSQRRELR